MAELICPYCRKDKCKQINNKKKGKYLIMVFNYGRKT